jgi:hypothetical protein
MTQLRHQASVSWAGWVPFSRGRVTIRCANAARSALQVVIRDDPSPTPTATFLCMCEMVHSGAVTAEANLRSPDGVSRFQCPGSARPPASYCVRRSCYIDTCSSRLYDPPRLERGQLRQELAATFSSMAGPAGPATASRPQNAGRLTTPSFDAELSRGIAIRLTPRCMGVTKPVPDRAPRRGLAAC